MENKSEPEPGVIAVPPLQIGKREGENEDNLQVSSKKHKRDVVAEDEIASDNSFSDFEPDLEDVDAHEADYSEESDEETQEKVEVLPEMLSSPNQQYTGSRTIYARNLSYSVERTDLENLFKECGEIADIRLHTDLEGRFKGFGHIEFATADAAQKALRLNYTELLRCRMRVGIARQKHEYTSNRSFHGNFSNSIQRTETTQPMKGSEISLDCEQETEPKMLSTPNELYAGSKTICAKNLSYSVERTDLENLFKECGEIVDIRLHTDREGRFRGFGHVEFATSEAAQNALQLNYTELLRCRMRLRLARQKDEYTSSRSNWSKSFLKSEITQPIESPKSSENCEEIEEKTSRIPWESSKRLPTLEAQIGPSKTVYVRNLSYSVERADMENFFKRCGEIVDVRLHRDHKGRLNGFGQVEFATAEAIIKAVELDNTELLRRPIGVYLAEEKGEYAYSRSNWTNSFQNYERDQSLPIIYVRGFDSSLPVEKIKASLEKHFGSCGEITRISVPKFHDSSVARGFAHLEFNNVVSANKALHLDQHKLGGYRLRVEKAKPRRENQNTTGGRGGGGHEFGGRNGSGCSSKTGWGRSGGGGWHSLHFSDEGTGSKNQFN